MNHVFFRPKRSIFKSLPAAFIMMIRMEIAGTKGIVQNRTIDGISLHFWTGMIK
jgi:hypothetical protein